MTTSSPAWFGWNRRSSPERFETYTRWSMYSVFGLQVMLALLTLTGSSDWAGPWPLVYLALVVGHSVLGVVVFSTALTRSRARLAFPVRPVAALSAATLVIWVVAAVGYPGAGSDYPIVWGMVVPAVGLLAALSPVATARRLLLVLAGLTACVVAVVAVIGADATTVGVTAVSSGLALLGVAMSCRLSVWTLAVVWELDEGRAVAARLAVAEERLRFSRDLHDVFGRTLSTVAVKSELAAALAGRQDPRGVQEMLEVRRIAHEALREVRGVAQGYRAADLDAEIAGARALLRSAGVECRVAGEGLALAEPVAEAAAWVVREGVTNVVRHAAATRCDIDVRAAGPDWVVTITNDGVAPATPAPEGGGLRGLRERLGERGGALEARTSGSTFVLTARVPGAPAAAGGTGPPVEVAAAPPATTTPRTTTQEPR